MCMFVNLHSTSSASSQAVHYLEYSDVQTVFTMGNWTFTKCKPLGSELLCSRGAQGMSTPHVQTWALLVKHMKTLGNF